jgi:hypothetical protein
MSRYLNPVFRSIAPQHPASRLQHSMVMDWACNAAEFLSLVTDLLWFINCPIAKSKPIYQLQAPCFPLGHRIRSSSGIDALVIGSSECPAMPASRGFGGLRQFSHSISARSLSGAIGMGLTALKCFGEQYGRTSKTVVALAAGRPQFVASRH